MPPPESLGPHLKAFPPSTWGRTVAEACAAAVTLDDFVTPVLTLDLSALEHNLTAMAAWTAQQGVRLAPHGKTTMAPQLWRRQLDAGAWAITLATPWQVQVARSVGVDRVLLANPLVDPVALAWLREVLAADRAFRFTCWADSVRTVDLTGDGLRRAVRPVDVLVELGGDGGRTGARTEAEALEVARRVAAAPALRLAGVGGYEGALAHDRGPSAMSAVRGYLTRLRDLHRRLRAEGLLDGRSVISVGGSAYVDSVVELLAPEADERTEVVLRSGAYVVHDDGFYASVSPLTGERALRSAMHVWARVLSRPEPGLALLDAGRRDLSTDEGLPSAQRVRGVPPAVGERWLAGSSVDRVNDQHCYLRLPDADRDALPVGSVVRLGLSHPCTVLDKWRAIPVVDDANAVDPRLVDVVATLF